MKAVGYELLGSQLYVDAETVNFYVNNSQYLYILLTLSIQR